MGQSNMGLSNRAGFRRTLAIALATSGVVYLALSVAGYLFMTSHENAIAETILTEHQGAIVSIYLRILVGYLATGVLVALALHPFVRGWKVVPAMGALAALGLLFTLTHETHLLYGPTQSLFCTVHDALPAWLRNLYAPWEVLAVFGALTLAAANWWAGGIRARWRIATAAIVVAALGLTSLPAGATDHPPARPSVLLIATDSLRADHLSCNGYPRETSPHIDALAARGTNFARCLVPTASTHESWLTMMSSTEPRKNGLRHMFPTRAKVNQIQRTEKFLPKMLADDGYRTGVIGGWCGTTFGIIDMGFDHVDVSNTQNHLALIAEAAFTNHLLAASFLDNVVGRLLLPELERVSFSRGSTAITSKAKRYLEGAAESGEPFFLTVVYHVTHLPYSASYPYYSLYTDPDYRGRNRYRIDFKIDEMIQRGFDHDLADVETQHIIDLYDGCVREFDDQVGALVAHLKQLGLLDNTIVGVLGDHGDDLYEHGTTLGHGVSLFGGDQANHIPAVFAGPGVPQRREDKLVRSFDLTPTWAGWLGVEPPERWQGVRLDDPVPDLTALLETSYLLYRQPVPDLKPGEKVKDFPRFDRATFLDPDFDHNIVLRPELEPAVVATKCFAVREGSWKLIRVPGEGGPIYRLFDLATDPQCKVDLVASRKAVFERLRHELPDLLRLKPNGEPE